MKEGSFRQCRMWLFKSDWRFLMGLRWVPPPAQPSSTKAKLRSNGHPPIDHPVHPNSHLLNTCIPTTENLRNIKFEVICLQLIKLHYYCIK